MSKSLKYAIEPNSQNTMPSKPKSQHQRFIETARELGCDEDPKAFERTFSKVVPPKKPTEKPTEAKAKKRRTDLA
jgi:hypothetical protein